MSHEQLGELAALATAVLWTLSAVAWTAAGRHIGALAVAFLRLVLATALMMLYGWWSRGKPLPLDASWFTWKMLGISGFVGFFVADLLLFKAFLLIGPRLSLLVTSLTPPLTVLISRAMREHESFGLRSWAGMCVTLAGVLWVVLERREGEGGKGDGDKGTQRVPGSILADTKIGTVPSRRQLRRGLLLALASAAVQALGFVLTKEGTAQFDPAAMALIRILGAVVGYVVLITVLRRWPVMTAAVKQRRTMLILTGGTIVGPCLGVTTLMLAFREGCHEGVVTTILATTPVMILPFSIFLHGERVSLRAFGGALVAVGGIAVLMWPA